MSEKPRNEGMLSVEEAEERARRAAGDLEALINRFNATPGKHHKPRSEDLFSHFMSLLAEAEGIVAEVDDEDDDRNPPSQTIARYQVARERRLSRPATARFIPSREYSS